MALTFDLHAAAVLAPGVNALEDLVALQRSGHSSADASVNLPAPPALPANERRRASQVVRLTLACIERVLESNPFPPDQLRMVFASDEGTGEVCRHMLDALATTRAVSPLVFHNSVHNAPSGYWSIACRNHQSATSISLGEQSFASGLLCAATEAAQGQPVLFVAYDAPLPPPMDALLPIAHPSATAWIIGAPSQRRALASCSLSLDSPHTETAPPPPCRLPETWTRNSSARGFEVLALLGCGGGEIELPLGGQRLRVVCSLPADTTC